jgi:hypothetical protein
MFPSSIEQAKRAFSDLANILKPRQKKGPGFTNPGLDKIVMEQLSGMKLFCFNYTYCTYFIIQPFNQCDTMRIESLTQSHQCVTACH